MKGRDVSWDKGDDYNKGGECRKDNKRPRQR